MFFLFLFGFIFIFLNFGHWVICGLFGQKSKRA